MKKIELRNGGFALVDDEDYEWLNQFKWRRTPWGYAEARKQINKERFNYKMHRLVNNTPKGFSTDHINHDKLDNRKSNLRTVNQSQNAMNCRPNKGKRFKGTHYSKRQECWLSYVSIDGKRVGLGAYATEIEAARAYNAAVKKHYPEHGFLNVVEDGPYTDLKKQLGVSKLRGVSLISKTGRWSSRISYDGYREVPGYFEDKEEAAKAYDLRALEIHGDKARLNFPELIEEYKLQIK